MKSSPPGAMRLQRLQDEAEEAPRASVMRGVIAAVTSGSDPLAALDEACRLLAECTDLAEIRQIRNMAEAARLYARAIDRGLKAQNSAAEIKIRAERRAGELLGEMVDNGARARTSAQTDRPQLADLGIEKHQSHRWQQMAQVPEDRFEAHLTAAKSQRKELSSAGVYSLAVREQKRAGTWPPPVLRDVSVYDSDPEALASLLHYFLPDPGNLLDVTYNEGRIWRGLPYSPDRADINPDLAKQGLTDFTVDFRNLPQTWTDRYQGIVFDPPHLTDSGHAGQWTAGGNLVAFSERYGLGTPGLTGVSVASLFLPFLHEAARVLTDGGIVLAKISNMVHSSRYQDQARALKNIAEGQAGFDHVFDAITVSESRGYLNDPRWKQALHPRTIHTYWIVLRRRKS